MQRDSYQQFRVLDRYNVKKKTFNQQFASLYSSRLKVLRKRVVDAVSKKYGKKYETLPVLEFKNKCILIGTLFKEMKQKPNLLKQFTQEIADIDEFENKEPAEYISPADKLYLEDEHGRVMIKFSENESENPKKLSIHQFVTGMVVGCLGAEQNGAFMVEDVVFPECPAPEKETTVIVKEEDEYICLISGLQIGNPASCRLKVQFFIDYLMGLNNSLQSLENSKNSESPAFGAGIPLQVVRTIFLGQNIVDASEFDENKKAEMFYHVRGSLKSKDAVSFVEPCKEFDDMIKQLLETMYVDVIPGENDPTNVALPQEKIPRFMFPQCGAFKTFKTVSNPYSFIIDGQKWITTSGQNISNIFKFSSIKDTIQAMEVSLQSNHLAPTAPDSLDCYAFTNNDQLVIESLPHVYVAGNQESFGCKIIENETGKNKQVMKTLLVSVPSFMKTGTFVLVNLNTLDCIPITIDLSEI